MATDLKFEKYSTIAHSFWQSIYEDNDEKTARSTTNMKDQKNITNNNQRLAKCVRSLVKVFFYFIDCAEKIIGVFSSRRPRKHLQLRSRLFVPHSQSASQPVQNGRCSGVMNERNLRTRLKWLYKCRIDICVVFVNASVTCPKLNI